MLYRHWFICFAVLAGDGVARAAEPATVLQVGFGERNISPAVGKAPVYMAGFGKNRTATGVHDPLMARAIVLTDGKTKIALVPADVVGLFHPFIEQVRKRLPGFTYVLVSSTHNHEGPDTLGLWGPNSLQSGVDAAFMRTVADGIVGAAMDADRGRRAAPVVRVGAAKAPDLLRDGRLPIVKHDELVALQFVDGGRTIGIVVQWNCHPETLASQNTKVSADFVGYAVAYLKEKYRCPVVYLTGTVGGLMTSLGVPVKDDSGKQLNDGTFAKTERYGRLVGELAQKALTAAKPVRMTPLEARSRALFLPMANPFYQLGWKLGVLDRQAYAWTGDIAKASPMPNKSAKGPFCVRTEIGYLKLGDVEIAAIPGEIYPELVLGKVQDPADPGADFPHAAVEPSIYGQMNGPHRMIIGLANDELGYIIPKRQWDEKPPFCYGRKTAQYGEGNSLGPDTAPLLCNAFRDLVKKK